jgi:hypothetical protein
MNLYQISSEYFEKLAYLNEVEDLTEEIINDTLMGYSDDAAKAIGAFCLNAEAEMEAMKEYEKKMYSRRVAIENRYDKYKAFLLKSMAANGIKKVPSTSEFSISLHKNPPKVEVDSTVKIESLPKECVVTETTHKVLKSELKKAIDNGAVIKGVRVVDSYRVDIK